MIDFIYKTVRPSHLKKLQMIQKINNLMFQVIFIFFDWILIKKIIVSSTPFRRWGKQIFEKMMSWEMSHFPLSRVWRQETGAGFEWWRVWVKMSTFNAFSGNVNSINFSHTWWNVQVWEKMLQDTSIGVSKKFHANPIWFFYLLSFLDFLILLICIAMVQIRGKGTHWGYCWCA